MVFRRWAYFFAVVLRGYSMAHNIANTLYFFPMYALALLSLLLPPKNGRRTTALTLFVVLILVTSAFHAALGIDFDHRYRLGILPALIMLAACGSCEVARTWRRQGQSSVNTSLNTRANAFAGGRPMR